MVGNSEVIQKRGCGKFVNLRAPTGLILHFQQPRFASLEIHLQMNKLRDRNEGRRRRAACHTLLPILVSFEI
jgi:hypothetical protein